jgi:hypothetical protein
MLLSERTSRASEAVLAVCSPSPPPCLPLLLCEVAESCAGADAVLRAANASAEAWARK